MKRITLQYYEKKKAQLGVGGYTRSSEGKTTTMPKLHSGEGIFFTSKAADVFKKFQTDPSELAFDKTEIQVRLYAMGTIHISRSQARRVMAGLEKFNVITLDFDRVPTVGQAFVDEVFRVFQNKYPHIRLIPVNMNKAVKFMVERGMTKA